MPKNTLHGFESATWPRFEDKPAINHKRIESLESLMESAGKLKFLESNNAWIKFWVPTILADALKESSRFRGDTMAIYLRQILYRHCYGEYIFMCFEKLELENRDHYVSHQEHTSSYEPIKDPVYWVPQLGKNIFPIRLALPNKVKQDLAKLAKRHDISLSQYIRETILSRLFGHGMVPGRPVTDVDEQESLYADQWSAEEQTVSSVSSPATDNRNHFYFDEK